MMSGPVASMDSGETSPAEATAPSGSYSGKKKEKTDGERYAYVIPIEE